MLMCACFADPDTRDSVLDQCDNCDGPPAAKAQALRDAMLDRTTAQNLSGIFRALGDPTRLRIIAALAERELCVSDLTAALEMEQPAVSHQLSDMRDLGLVRARKEGRHVYYRLDDEHVYDLFHQALAHIRHTQEAAA
jgi:DNA-binding transcriptional ArsR family regulator